MTEEKLRTYREKRDFTRTSEPSGAATRTEEPGGAGAAPPRFVVQRHRARRLHYDLRFEIDGVLVSWAVPKGPTLDPSVRRMAARTEDHPMEYASFEGVIPKGEYGGGDVIVWDEGTWELHKHDDAASALADGELHVELRGHKLRGRFVLVRTKVRDGGEDWLLLHKHDEHAVEGWDPEDHPRSVRTGRTNEEVAADPDAIWSSDAPPARAEILLRPLSADDPELAALHALGTKGTWRFRGRDLRLTNLDKVLFPGRDDSRPEDREPVTKRDLIAYYASFSPLLVQHLGGRPVNLHRFPNGVEEPGFWHKAVPKHAPEWIERWDNPAADRGETRTYFVASEPATVAWLANYGAIELHPWTSTTAHPGQPSYALFDLDPGDDTSWEDLVVLARLHRTALEHLGVRGFPKVTGRRGIQIWVPVVDGYTFEETRSWVESVSRAVGRTVPDLVSWQWGVKERGGLARLDFTQNALNKTLVAPYSVRPSPGAPVSAPITWDELDDPDLRPDRWTVRTIRERVEATGDLYRDIRSHAQRLPELT